MNSRPPMDDLARFNRERWNALSRAGVMFSRPALNLDAASAWEMIDPEQVMRERGLDLAGRRVLCLAGGGGQQSAAFAILGAEVTVVDLSEAQLERDQEAADHYGYALRALQGDMRDLGMLAGERFDVVYHAHSLNFVPDAREVFAQVASVTAPGGLYRMSCANPFFMGVDDRHWNGTGYTLSRPYVEGEELVDPDPYWDVEQPDGSTRRIEGPREFRHGLHTLFDGPLSEGFALIGVWEDSMDPALPDAESGSPPTPEPGSAAHGTPPPGTPLPGTPLPGTWDHFTTIAPPWLVFWWRRPEG